MDTATSLVVVALHDGDSLLSGRAVPARQAHAEVLAPLVDEVLAEAGRPTLTHVVAGVGPGPFTGLRVGIVTAEVMAHALGIPALGVCSLDAVAREVEQQTGQVEFTVLTDARRREVYAAHYRHGVRTQGPEVLVPAQALTLGAPRVGEGAALYADITGHVGEPVRMTPASLASVAVAAVTTGASLPLSPLYLRRPDATEPAATRPS